MTTHFCVLPTEIKESFSSCSQQISYLRLPHPRTGLPSLFLPTESDEGSSGTTKSQILEVQAINPVESRSWFLGDEVVADGKLLLMTPVDPVFLLLGILQCVQSSDGSVGQFRPADDILEEAALKMSQNSLSQKDAQVTSGDILRFSRLRCTRTALKFICDVKDITEEITVYRYSHAKTMEHLRQKAARLSHPKILEKSRTITRGFAKDGLMEDGNEKLLESAQVRAACELLSHYLPANIRDSLYALYDFTQLDTFLRNSAAEAMALTSIPQNVDKTKKSANTTNGEKKRKSAKGSHGVEALKKANVNGMAKLSTFFAKAEKVPS